ncbi:MAG: phosphopyruvate hydratase [Thermoplasmata archaeon]|nr:MAG: phosphopyruvate hydratase [Thermoplasmata archaeon]
MLTKIEEVAIRRILDSRGNPTVEVDIYTQNGFGSASAPSGASTGANEVMAYPKEGLEAAVANFKKEVMPRLLGMDAAEQEEIDVMLYEVDRTNDFSKVGGNVAVATSLAAAKAAAHSFGLPLYKYLGGAFANCTPLPMGNVLGGGKHAVGGTDIQEYSALSIGPTVRESIFANASVHASVKRRLMERFPEKALGKGDEGAWNAEMGNDEALELVSDACTEVADKLHFPVRPCLDIAASELFSEGRYYYKNQALNQEGQIDFVTELIEKYDLFLVEDPLDQEDFEGYAELTKAVGDRCLIVGDDLFVTNSVRLERGIKMGAGNAILIKPNQVGTLTKTIETIKLAHESGYKTVVSHRSGETNDDTIAHLAVAFGCHAIKTGAVGGERTAKLNELIRIEEELIKSEG